MAYTTIDDASLYFRVKTYTGNSTNNTAITWDETHSNMQPDWIWLKNRTDAQEHWLADSVRGADKFLESNSTNAEADGTSGFDSFDANGFTVDNSARTNRNTMVGWGWKAGGSASSNTDGSITSTVSANISAGFSIVSFTGTGSNATVGHGLGVAPKVIITKSRVNAENWGFYHQSLGNGKQLELNTTAAQKTSSAYYNNTSPTSTVFSVGTADSTNDNQNMIAYCFADTGNKFFKAGSYTGNGNADGNFIYTGFKPAFILLKNTGNASAEWRIYDNKRDPSNVMTKCLQPHSSDAEETTSNIDFLSNGWKVRSNDGNLNQSGYNFIYMCFAESPFVTSGGIPTTAR